MSATEVKAKQKGVTWRHAPLDPDLLEAKTAEEKKHLRELYNRCAVGPLGNSSCVMWQPGPVKPVKFMSKRHAHELEATRIVTVKGEGGGTKKLDMFTEYFKWEGRRAYDEIRFAPGLNDPSVYNLFSGWTVKPAVGDWSIFRAHLLNVLCNGDEALFGWFMTWLAHMFQRPGEKVPVAIVVRGEKGCGKSIIFDTIGRLMREHVTVIADGKRALGNFNGALETTLMLVMEEAVWAGDHAQESKLKDLITNNKQMIERKGFEQYRADNYIRVVMTSNAQWVVPASFRERRYAFFDSSNARCGDIPYFKAMDEQMHSGGLAAMLHDLLAYIPENGWDVLWRAPTSHALQEQAVESLRGKDRFMFDLLVSGSYECDQCDEGGIFLSDHASTVSLKDVRTAVRDYLADHYPGERGVNFSILQRAVQEWFGARTVSRKAKKNDVPWVEFPPIAECRNHAAEFKHVKLPEPPTVH